MNYPVDVALVAAGLGAISGLRSTSGLAFVSRTAANGDIDLGGTRFAALGSPLAARMFLVAQVGEIVGDKLPGTPGRTTLPPLLGRAVSGALVGAAVFASRGRGVSGGATIGAASAVAAAFAGENLRALAAERTGVPDPLLGLVEDGVVVALGSRLADYGR